MDVYYLHISLSLCQIKVSYGPWLWALFDSFDSGGVCFMGPQMGCGSRGSRYAIIKALGPNIHDLHGMALKLYIPY